MAKKKTDPKDEAPSLVEPEEPPPAEDAGELPVSASEPELEASKDADENEHEDESRHAQREDASTAPLRGRGAGQFRTAEHHTPPRGAAAAGFVRVRVRKGAGKIAYATQAGHHHEYEEGETFEAREHHAEVLLRAHLVARVDSGDDGEG